MFNLDSKKQSHQVVSAIPPVSCHCLGAAQSSPVLPKVALPAPVSCQLLLRPLWLWPNGLQFPWWSEDAAATLNPNRGWTCHRLLTESLQLSDLPINYIHATTTFLESRWQNSPILSNSTIHISLLSPLLQPLHSCANVYVRRRFKTQT